MRLLGMASTALFLGISAFGSAAWAEGDVAAGEKVFKKCKACHVVDGPKHRVGPSLQNVIGRIAGTAEGYKFSKAMKAYGESGVVWNAETLAPYLEKPRRAVPGTKMSFPGLKKPEDLENVIAYMAQFSEQQAAAEETTMPAESLSATADLINNAGDSIGSLRVRQGPKGVVINIEARSLPPGYHGMHFHTVGDCSDLEAFKASGGHVNPNSLPHGFLNPDGPHEGNLPNLIVPENGSVEVELYSVMVSLSEGPASLLDEDGAALIIHTDPDDHVTQPIGGAGARIACGVVKADS